MGGKEEEKGRGSEGFFLADRFIATINQLTSIKLSSRMSSTTFSTRWLLGGAIPSTFSACAAASEAKPLRGLKNWEEEDAEERKIVVGHSAAAVNIDAEEPLKDEEQELVDAPAPAAAREQAELSDASRERVASWAAARRSIRFFGC